MSSKQQSRSVIACLVAALWFLPLSCLAEGSAPATKQTQAIRADIFDQLSKAQVAQEKGNYAEALKYLDAIRAASSKKPLQPYEEAQLWNFYAYVYLAQEKQESAINAFEKILALPEIPESLALSARYALAQLYLVQGDIKKGIRMLEQWFARATNPAPDAYVMLGQAYLQEKRLDEAQKALLTALEVARQQGKAEKENWYLLLQYVYGEKQQYRKQEEILKILVSRWPKKTYWLSLFGVYSELDNQAGQLNVLETAYVQGFLDQKGYLLTLAQLLAANGMPYKAARVYGKRSRR
jgi:tetratricopeptide (TPR) repeat protein